MRKLKFVSLLSVVLLAANVVAGASGDPIGFSLDREPDNDSRVKPAKLIQRVEPVYPANELPKKLQDEVYVAFVVNEKGGVEKARAFFSNYDLFEGAAVDAVKQWRFEPATMAGHPIKVRMVVSIRFAAPKE
ncbi:MAG TPA: energy transducer TonB [Opitutaceae bacterium]|nr:energy transducer TonB [Opitutaceae bacterium]